jgi:hypothetical protein
MPHGEFDIYNKGQVSWLHTLHTKLNILEGGNLTINLKTEIFS